MIDAFFATEFENLVKHQVPHPHSPECSPRQPQHLRASSHGWRHGSVKNKPSNAPVGHHPRGNDPSTLMHVIACYLSAAFAKNMPEWAMVVCVPGPTVPKKIAEAEPTAYKLSDCWLSERILNNGEVEKSGEQFDRKVQGVPCCRKRRALASHTCLACLTIRSTKTQTYSLNNRTELVQLRKRGSISAPNLQTARS
jgi:hypothetical protein